MDDDSPNKSEDEHADSNRPTTSIPAYKHGEEIIAWTEVDAEWWEHVQHAMEVHEEVVATYGGEPGILSIERGIGTETIAERATTAIIILVADEVTADALALPGAIEGIPLIIEMGDVKDT